MKPEQDYVNEREAVSDQRELGGPINDSININTTSRPRPQVRAALEPSGYYVTSTNSSHVDSQETPSQNQHASANQDALSYSYSYSNMNDVATENNTRQQEPQQAQHLDENLPTADDSNANFPPWSPLQSQFPLPRKTPPVPASRLGDENSSSNNSNNNSNNKAISTSSHNAKYRHKKPCLSSYDELWSKMIAASSSSSSCSRNPTVMIDPTTSSATNTQRQSDPTNLPPTPMASVSSKKARERTLIRDKIRDDFQRAIVNSKIPITNDTSITGRYNKEYIYKPFGFVPSTDRACKEEIYEVIKPSSALCSGYSYNDYDDDSNKNQMNIQHYQSWDPKTMQYSPQPYNMFHPSNSQFPLTSPLNAAAKTRAALLSIMRDSNIPSEDVASRSRSSNINHEIKQELNHNNNNNNINNSSSNNNSLNNLNSRIGHADTTHDRFGQDNISADTFGRRHSLYMPQPSFESLVNDDYVSFSRQAPTNESSSSINRHSHPHLSINTSTSTSTSINPNISNNYDNSTRSRVVAEELMRMNDINNSRTSYNVARSNNRTSRKRSTTSSAYHKDTRKRDSDSSLLHKKKKKKKNRSGSSNNLSEVRKKRDGSPLRRSSRRRQKRSFGDDSSTSSDGF